MQQCIFSIGTRDIVAIPPTDRIRTSHLEVSRDRVLTQEELRYLLVALEAERGAIGPLIQILLLTGQLPSLENDDAAGEEFILAHPYDRDLTLEE